jgi:cytochrome P450
MVETAETRKLQATRRALGNGNFLSKLVQKPEERRKEGSTTGSTDSELYGNMFIFSFAGHETTANSLTHAIYLFAAFHSGRSGPERRFSTPFPVSKALKP